MLWLPRMIVGELSGGSGIWAVLPRPIEQCSWSMRSNARPNSRPAPTGGPDPCPLITWKIAWIAFWQPDRAKSHTTSPRIGPLIAASMRSGPGPEAPGPPLRRGCLPSMHSGPQSAAHRLLARATDRPRAYAACPAWVSASSSVGIVHEQRYRRRGRCTGDRHDHLRGPVMA